MRVCANGRMRETELRNPEGQMYFAPSKKENLTDFKEDSDQGDGD